MRIFASIPKQCRFEVAEVAPATWPQGVAPDAGPGACSRTTTTTTTATTTTTTTTTTSTTPVPPDSPEPTPLPLSAPLHARAAARAGGSGAAVGGRPEAGVLSAGEFVHSRLHKLLDHFFP